MRLELSSEPDVRWVTPMKNREKAAVFNRIAAPDNAEDVDWFFGRLRYPARIAMVPIGTFKANNHCHEALERMIEANTGPENAAMAATIDTAASLRPSNASEYINRSSAALTAIIPDAPTPCRTRAATNACSESTKMASKDAAVKSTSPNRYTLPCPQRSPIAANGSSMTRMAI